MEERKYTDDVVVGDDIITELSDQAEKFCYWSDRLADASFERDKIKNDLDVVKAKLGNEARDNWETYFPKSPTVAMVDDWITLHEDHQEKLSELNEAQHVVNLLMGAKTAMEQKSKMIVKLADMEMSGFHSEPKVQNGLVKKEQRRAFEKDHSAITKGKEAEFKKHLKKDK